MAMTEDELRVLLGMGDVGGKEADALRQQLLAQNLRGTMGDIKGYRTGSNIGRAGYGIAGAIGDYQAKRSSADASTMKQELLARLLRARQGTPAQMPPIYPQQEGYMRPDTEY